MRLVFTQRFWREYYKLPSIVQGQVNKALELLAKNPQHPSLRTHKRKDDKTTWQARVTRSYRILFEMEGEIVTLMKVVAYEK